MTIPLAEWDEKVGRHLHYIEAGADMCLRHAHQVAFRPDFETLAASDLERAERVLEAALRKISAAIMRYRETPTDA